MPSILYFFASCGNFVIGAGVLAATVCAVCFCTGVLFEQVGPNIFNASEDKSVYNGLKSGAMAGLLWGAFALYQVGVWSTLLSDIGLCACLLLLAWLTWLVTACRRPINDSDNG